MGTCRSLFIRYRCRRIANCLGGVDRCAMKKKISVMNNSERNSVKLIPGTPIETIFFDDGTEFSTFVERDGAITNEYDTIEMTIIEMCGQMAMVPYIREVRRNGDIFLWNVACLAGFKLTTGAL